MGFGAEKKRFRKYFRRLFVLIRRLFSSSSYQELCIFTLSGLRKGPGIVQS